MNNMPLSEGVAVLGVVFPLDEADGASLGAGEVLVFSLGELLEEGRLDAAHPELLLVGGPCEPLKKILPAVRARRPNLPVAALVGGLERHDRIFYRNHADGLFQLPEDKAALLELRSQSLYGQTPNMRKALAGKLLKGVASLALLIMVWWLAVLVFAPPPYFLPSPLSVVKALGAQADRFILHMGVTALEAFAGFVLGNGVGIAAAVVLHRYSMLQKLTLPALISLQAIPIMALAPLFVVWFGPGLASKIIMVGVLCFFPVIVNMLQAFSGIDRDYVDLFRFYKADYKATLAMLLIPGSFPQLVASLKISAGLAVVGAIVAELTGASVGLGYLILNASYRLQTDVLFAAMVLASALGVVFFQLPGLLRGVLPKSWGRGLQ